MIKYGALLFAIAGLVAIQPASGQAGPQGDKSVGATEEWRPLVLASVVPAKIGMINERGGDQYSEGPLDRAAWALEYKVENVREMWIKSEKQNPSEVDTVRKSALESANALAGIPDLQLHLGGLIIKDEYSCFGYVIASANTTKKSIQSLLAKRAEHFCKMAAIDLAKADSPKDSNARAVKAWESHGEEHPRIAYLLAMSKCLEGTSSGNLRSEIEARDILSTEIPSYYLLRYPPEKDYVLRACVNN